MNEDLTYWECLERYGDVLGKRVWEEQQEKKGGKNNENKRDT